MTKGIENLKKLACFRFTVIIFQKIKNIYRTMFDLKPYVHLKIVCIVNNNKYIPDKAVQYLGTFLGVWLFQNFFLDENDISPVQITF